MITQQLQQFFTNYFHAFTTQNHVKTLACYQFPCSLATPEQLIFIADEIQAEQEFSQLFSWLKQAHVYKIEAGSASFSNISDNLFIVNICWFFFDCDEHIITDFTALYHVIKTNEQLKIFQVISHEITSSIRLSFPLTLGLTYKNDS